MLFMEEATLTLLCHLTVAFLIVFGALLIMMLWAYAKVRVTALRLSVIVLTRRRCV